MNRRKSNNAVSVSSVASTHSDSAPAPPSAGGEEVRKLKKRIEQMEKTVELLMSKNEELETKISKLKLEDLSNVDLEGRLEDGAFLGWAEEENVWVPFPEVGG
tara:strand:+ start:1820 stop:2128 length:309 start_codon:yes stop_codon:yes gene_type:complete